MVVALLLLIDDVFGIVDVVALSQVHMNVVRATLLTLLIEVELLLSVLVFPVLRLFTFGFNRCVLLEPVRFGGWLSLKEVGLAARCDVVGDTGKALTAG